MNEIRQKVLAFRDERGWKKYHSEKDLAISVSLEASELLENFQWHYQVWPRYRQIGYSNNVPGNIQNLDASC